MSNKPELKQIHSTLREVHGWTSKESVGHIASLLGKQPTTVYAWLSERHQDIPTNELRLLKLLIHDELFVKSERQ